MEKFYVHLLPTFNSSFKIFEENQLLMTLSSTESLNDIIDLEFLNPQDFEIRVYPIGRSRGRFSYTAQFNFIEDKLISKNEYVKVYNLSEKHFLIKFLSLSREKEEIKGDKIEINGSEIKKLTFLNDLAGRAKVEVFKIEDNKIRSQRKYFVRTSEDSPLEVHPDLILLAFFEAYKSDDFNLCFSYLAESYKKNLNKEGLQDFFGVFDDCILVNYYANPAVVLLYEDHSVVFSANIQDDKIRDIYELT